MAPSVAWPAVFGLFFFGAERLRASEGIARLCRSYRTQMANFLGPLMQYVALRTTLSSNKGPQNSYMTIWKLFTPLKYDSRESSESAPEERLRATRAACRSLFCGFRGSSAHGRDLPLFSLGEIWFGIRAFGFGHASLDRKGLRV